jgi:UDP-GlcNAc:undecaprenyl-phosphate GlcNAc-1-phosphate transferase
MNYLDKIVPVVISFVVSAILTYVVLKIGQKYKLGLPIRERDVHQKLIPRIGGVAIFLSFLFVALAYHLHDSSSFSGFGFPFAVLGFSIDKRLLAVLAGGAVLVAFMFVDDIRGLSASKKLLAQILVAFIVIAGGIGITYINNPLLGPTIYLNSTLIPVTLGGVVYHIVLWADLLAVVWLILLMNVINFSDGIDGLAGTISAIALLVISILSSRLPVDQPATMLLALIGLGSVLGFLVWNLPPAKIFMGDSGAMFLGYLTAVLAIIAGAKLATTLVVLALPIIDSMIVIIGRLVKGKNPMTHADKSHLHHRLLAAGLTVRQTVLVLCGLSVLFGIAALQNNGIGKITIFIIATAVVLLIVWWSSVKANRRQQDLI